MLEERFQRAKITFKDAQMHTTAITY